MQRQNPLIWRQRFLKKLEPVLLVGIGGFAGANLRYAVDIVIPSVVVGTFLVNVVGSFALGVLVYDSLDSPVIAENSRLVFGTGFLSSFTTYSTFVLDTIRIEPLLAAGYVLSSYIVGFLAVLAGKVVTEGGDW